MSLPDGLLSRNSGYMFKLTEEDADYLKRFILAFDSGVIVIKHWRIHNYIQKDRYKQTVYAEERAQLRIKENKAYRVLKDSKARKDSTVKTVILLEKRLIIGLKRTKSRL